LDSLRPGSREMEEGGSWEGQNFQQLKKGSTWKKKKKIWGSSIQNLTCQLNTLTDISCGFLSLYIKLDRQYLNIGLLQNLPKSLFILIIIIWCNVTFFINRGLLNTPRNPASNMSSKCELRIKKDCGYFLGFIQNQTLVSCKVLMFTVDFTNFIEN
jgi:hypothetical protein